MKTNEQIAEEMSFKANRIYTDGPEFSFMESVKMIIPLVEMLECIKTAHAAQKVLNECCGNIHNAATIESAAIDLNCTLHTLRTALTKLGYKPEEMGL